MAGFTPFHQCALSNESGEMHLTIVASTVSICHKNRGHPLQRCLPKPSGKTSVWTEICMPVIDTSALESVYCRTLNVAI